MSSFSINLTIYKLKFDMYTHRKIILWILNYVLKYTIVNRSDLARIIEA